MELTCITCPRGCHITYDLENGKAINIQGNSCPRGKIFCEKEVVNPERMITSTVRIHGAIYNQLPIITSAPVSKDKIFDVVDEIKKVEVNAPIHVNDVIISNVLNTGVDILAARSMDIHK